MKKILFLSVVAAALLLGSCGDSTPGGSMLPNVSGSSGEILVVMDRAEWEGELGEKIRNVLADPIDRLPQPEPEFDLVNVTPGAFSKLYLTHRNVVMIDKKVENGAKVTFLEDTYALSQLIINIRGENKEDIMGLLDEEGQAIVNKINIAERDRWIKVYKRSVNSVIFNKLRDKYGMNIHMPSNFSLDVEEPGFMWFSYETPTTTQSILIHYFDLDGGNYFNRDSIESIRNRMTRRNVKGPSDGSYMTIEDRVPIRYRQFRFRNRNYAEMRGLWTLEKGFMGGPFVNLVTEDEVNNRFVMVDAFVYAPNEEKRELLRQVEAIIYTISFPDDKEVVVTPGK